MPEDQQSKPFDATPAVAASTAAGESVPKSTRQARECVPEPAPQALPSKTSALTEKGGYLDDDRDTFSNGHKSVLIIEDDRAFAKIPVALSRQKGYKALAVLQWTFTGILSRLKA